MYENIKARVRVYFNNKEKPAMSIQEFNRLKEVYYPYDNRRLKVGDIITVNKEDYVLTSVSTEVLEETRDDHLIYGIETARTGEGMPYNYEVELYFEKV